MESADQFNPDKTNIWMICSVISWIEVYTKDASDTRYDLDDNTNAKS